jgi:hypothetical protein
MSTLDGANVVRIEQARLKREIRAGRLSLADALEKPAFARTMVWDLLLALPPRQEAIERAERLIEGGECSHYRRVGELSLRQRTLLVRHHSLMTAGVRPAGRL